MDRRKFEILCVTMRQNGPSAKLREMNVHSDIVYANQTDHTSYEEVCYDGEHTARMISTATRGVGINRNLALMYADAEYCLFADDDVQYVDNVEEIVVSEFKSHPDADVFIFNLDTEGNERIQKKYPKTRKVRPLERMPWGGCRIAIRLDAVKKANIWFTTLFGGGTVFPSGEDSIWIETAKRAGLTFYVSKETVGRVSFGDSTWFQGANEKFFYGKGAFYAACRPKMIWLWILYFAIRTRSASALTWKDKIKWMRIGARQYRNLIPYDVYIQQISKHD